MNASTRSARVVVEALLAAGVRDVVLCPGSRSAPLAYAMHQAELAALLRLHVRHDERSAGFCALGFGKAGSLAAVVTTSGTAVANLLPAVLEAHHADVPLVVLSADRPHSLRGTWANQTSDLQAGLFGPAVRVASDLPAAGDEDGERWRLAVVEAVRAARGTSGRRPGPVHLNLAFDEPLVPADDERWRPSVGPGAVEVEQAPVGDDVEVVVHAGIEEGDGQTGLGDRRLTAGDARPLDAPRTADNPLPAGPRTVVVAGDGAGPTARWLAEARGWPLLAEPSSGARCGPNAVGPYRLLLSDAGLGGEIERVVVLGRPTLSRPVTRLLARPDVDVVLVAAYSGQPGPGREVTRLMAGPEVAGECGWSVPPAPPDAWLARWLTAGQAAARAVDEVLECDSEASALSGPLVAREMSAATRPPELLVAAASNPIRDLDLAARPPACGGPTVLANRGVSGIDGTVSTAVGAALATNAQTRALVGDLAFLHDLGGLAVPAGERDRLWLQVVVLNDDGGGIFATLEHGEPGRTRHFERVFGTPHGSDLRMLCRGFAVPHERVRDLPSLRKALADVPRGLSVLEVQADRSCLRRLHERIREAVGAAVGNGLA